MGSYWLCDIFSHSELLHDLWWRKTSAETSRCIHIPTGFYSGENCSGYICHYSENNWRILDKMNYLWILNYLIVQLYLCLVRIVPNTPIPLYINMFTTVLKTYSFILLSYFAFLLSFAFAFSLVYAHEEIEVTPTMNNNSTQGETDHFGTLWLSLVKVSFILPFFKM